MATAATAASSSSYAAAAAAAAAVAHDDDTNNADGRVSFVSKNATHPTRSKIDMRTNPILSL